MALQEEINELFNLIKNHTDEIEHINCFIRMKNATIFKYKMDKRKEFRLKLRAKEEERKRQEKKEKKNRKKTG
ncbi:MAG: hypothetical protein JW904_15300 [Spirochaetales bacterium]|nr:hypothetical protein [Spirochaetales bacterium]